MSTTETILALVCVCGDLPVGVPSGCVTVRRDGLAAVCVEHDAHLLVGEDGERNLSDPVRVTDLAVAHAALVERVWRQTPAMPVAFGSLFHDARSVERLIESNHATIQSYLDELKGCQEWGGKATIDARLARAQFAERAVASAGLSPEMSPGARYFKEQAIRKQASARFATATEDACVLLQLRLTGLSKKLARRAILARHDDRQTVGSWALMIDDAMGALEAQIARLNETVEPDGLRLELSGPWPAWSFVPKLG